MRLSLRGEYALRALVVLGANYQKPVVRIQTISEQQNIPKRFLEQILNELRSAGAVESKRGVAGGYAPGLPAGQLKPPRVICPNDGSLGPGPGVGERLFLKCSFPEGGP